MNLKTSPLSEMGLAEQSAKLDALQKKWRKRQQLQEYEESKRIGWVKASEQCVISLRMAKASLYVPSWTAVGTVCRRSQNIQGSQVGRQAWATDRTCAYDRGPSAARSVNASGANVVPWASQRRE